MRQCRFLGDGTGSTATKILAAKELTPSASPAKRKGQAKESSLPWTEKYRPKAIVDIIGNKSLVFFYVAFFFNGYTSELKDITWSNFTFYMVHDQVEQIQRWLESWDEHFLNAASKGKGKKQNDSGAKKAVLLSGMPGIGKTTSAKVVSQLLGFQTIEVFSF